MTDMHSIRLLPCDNQLELGPQIHYEPCTAGKRGQANAGNKVPMDADVKHRRKLSLHTQLPTFLTDLPYSDLRYLFLTNLRVGSALTAASLA